MEYIDKWDGKLPAVAGGDSSSMLIDISEIIKEMETKSGTSKTANTAPAVSAPVSVQDNTPEDEVPEE